MSAGSSHSMGGSMSGLWKDHRLQVRVIEAKNLPSEDTNCVIRIDQNPQSQAKTKTIWRSQCPFYDEEYEFILDDNFVLFTVEIYSRNKFLKDTCIGVVKIPKLSLELDNLFHEAWFPIFPPSTKDDLPASPKEDSRRSHTFSEKYFAVPRGCDHCSKLIWKSQACVCSECGFACHAKCSELCRPTCGTKGAVRIRYKYTEEYVLPLPYYSKLLEIITNDDLELVRIYGKVTEEREEAAKTMVRVMEYMGQAVPFISALNASDVRNSDEKTIFRANSIASKALDYYMKLIGMPYLFSVLKPVMDEIIKAEKSCELDPTRLEKNEDVEANRTIILAYLEWIVTKIFESISQCPVPLRQIFHNLQEEVVRKYPDNETIRYTSVSGYLFLRFFNAAILGPKLFGLCGEHPNQKVSRTLTLISKTVQQLANLLIFDVKEPFMAVLNEFILRNKDKMQMFIKKIASVPNEPSTPLLKSKKDPTLEKVKKSKHLTVGPSKIDSHGGLDGKDNGIDIRFELASLHRLFTRARGSLEEVYQQTQLEKLKRLLEILDGLEAATEKRKREAEEQREREAQKAIEHEFSLEEFLGITPKRQSSFLSRQPSTEGRRASSLSSHSKSSETLDSDLLLADIKFTLSKDCVIEMKELFSLCDRSRTGWISRDDFEMILFSQNLDPHSEQVLKPLRQQGLDQKGLLSLQDFEKALLVLETALASPPQDPVEEAADTLLSYFSPDGNQEPSPCLELDTLRKLLGTFGKSLSEDHARRMLDFFAQQPEGKVDLKAFLRDV